jgi:(S)-ureidoglycine aminohydrolase
MQCPVVGCRGKRHCNMDRADLGSCHRRSNSCDAPNLYQLWISIVIGCVRSSCAACGAMLYFNMRILFVCSFVLFAIVVRAQPVASLKYDWKKPATRVGSHWSTRLFEGEAHDMSSIRMTSNAVTSRAETMKVPATEEQLLIVRSGNLKLTINDSTTTIGGGSVAVLMPGQSYTWQNGSPSDSCTLFMLSYRSKAPTDNERGMRAGGSLVKDWNRIKFTPHDKGGIRRYFERSTAMCKRLEMHVTTLNEGLKSHDPHTHAAEEIVIVIEGKTEMQIGETLFKGGPGAVYYLGSNKAHAIRNDGTGTCTYFAFQFV